MNIFFIAILSPQSYSLIHFNFQKLGEHIKSFEVRPEEKQTFLQTNMIERFTEIQKDHMKEHKRLQVDSPNNYYILCLN